MFYLNVFQRKGNTYVFIKLIDTCNISDGCENKKCEFYAVCESDGVTEASCVCPKHCEDGTVRRKTVTDLILLFVTCRTIIRIKIV